MPNIPLRFFPDDLRECILFHGHVCPGLIYGYRVAKEASQLLDIGKAVDEEVFAISENDSCAVDALQVILGTTTGKGNLLVKNYGKSVFLIAARNKGKALRFSRKTPYHYEGTERAEYEKLETKSAEGTLTEKEKERLKLLKCIDLLKREFSELFEREYVSVPDIPYAPLDPSEPCSLCGEMTMASKLREICGKKYCIPCTEKAIEKEVETRR